MPSTYDTEITSTLVGRRETDDWPHFEWIVTLTRHGVVRDAMRLPYKMGLGNQRTKCGKPMPSSRYKVMPCHHVTCERVGWQPTPPTLYDVLCSLKADVTHGATFEDWCADFGYDTDSMKARDLYFACQQSEMASRRFFGSDWQAILDDEDYT